MEGVCLVCLLVCAVAVVVGGSLATRWRPAESGGQRGSRMGAICGTDGICDGARK